MPIFAANLSMMFSEVSFLDRFGTAAEAGFRALECLFPYDTMAGLAPVLTVAPAGAAVVPAGE